MKSEERGTDAARLRMTLDLFRSGEELMRLNLGRRFPSCDAAKIERRLSAWLQAEAGDEESEYFKRRSWAI